MPKAEQNIDKAATESKSAGRLMRWDPFGELWRETEPFWGRFRMPSWALREQGEESWMPRLDVFNRNGDLVVKADLPGMSKKDIDVSVENGNLVVKGERKHESEVKEENYYRCERGFGSFYRRLPLPEGVDPAKVKAHFADGVLEVDVPLPEVKEAGAQKVPVD